MLRLLISIAILSAFAYGEGVSADFDAAKIDPGTGNRYDPRPGGSPRHVVYEDSSMNQYGFWTSMHDCIKGHGDTIVVLFRRYGDGTLGSGAGGLIWTLDLGESWYIDWPMNDGLLHDPHPGMYYLRYPSACIHPMAPAAAGPELLAGGAGWGYIMVGNEIDWHTAGFYGAFSDNLSAHKAWPWLRFADSLIVGLAQDEGDNNIFFSYSPYIGDFINDGYVVPELEGFSTYFLEHPTIPPDIYITGGFHTGLGGLAFATSPDCSTWTDPELLDSPGAPQSWTVTWIDGTFAPDRVTPLIAAGLDATGSLDQANEIWVFRPDTAVRVDVGLDTYNHYPQFAINYETGEMSVLWCEASHTEIDPTIDGWWHDIYYATSYDSGYTWTDPENYTNTPDINEVMLQVARHNRAFSYLTTLDASQGDLYWGVLGGGAFDAYESRMFIDVNLVDVKEDAGPSGSIVVPLNLRCHAHGSLLEISFTLNDPGIVDLSFFDVTGRKLMSRSEARDKGNHELKWRTKGLRRGVYILRLESGTTEGTTKVLISR
jgi:hypothetical protein